MPDRAPRLRAPLAGLATLLLLSACGSDVIVTPTPPPTRSGAAATSAAAACTPAPSGGDNFSEAVSLTTTADGLQHGDIVIGTGQTAAKGDNLTVQYTGWLTNGCVFDSSRQPGRSPFQFVIGATPPNVIAGWDEGLLTMRVGGKRRLVIPPALAYGSAGQGSIPPNATLVFDVQLLGISGAAPSPT